MRLSVKLVLFLGIIGLQIATVSAIVGLSYVSAERALMSLANRVMRFAAADAADHLQGFFKPAHDAAVLTERLAEHEVLRTGDSALMERYFYNQLKLTSWLDGIFYGRKDGSFVFIRSDDRHARGGFFTKLIDVEGDDREVKVIRRTAEFEEIAREFEPEDDFDPRTRPWFKSAIAAEGPTWTQPYVFFTSGHPGISTAVAVRDESGRFVGVVGVDIVIADLADFLASLNIGRKGAAFILDRDGDVIAFPEVETLMDSSDSLDEGLRFATVGNLDVPVAKAAVLSLGESLSDLDISGEIFGRFTADGRHYVSMAVPLPKDDWQWVLGLYLPEDVILGDIRRTRLVNIALAGAIVAIACVVGFFIWRGVARFLDAMRRGALAVEAGRLDDGWSFESRFREFEDTAGVFKRMFDELRRRDRRNGELTQSLRDEIVSREQTESDLTASEERYALALAGSNDGIWDWDITADRVVLSPRLGEILGLGAEARRLASSDVYELIHPDDREPYRSALIDHLKSGTGLFARECRLVRRGGEEIWALARGSALWNEQGRAYRMAGSVTDVTERKRAEEHLRQSQKMEALGSLAGGIAHEFNNQLVPIMALTELALQDLPADSELRANLRQVLAAAERSQELIEQILAYSRKRPIRPRPVNLKVVVERALDLLQPALPANVTLRTKIGEPPGHVLADETQLQSVVLNLGTNAAHAIGFENGTIEIALRSVDLAGAPGTAALGLSPGPHFELTVADDGQGMDSETMERIFDPFFTTKPEGQGTGMGLAIVSGILAGLGGAIGVESQPGQGATFRLLLPVCEDQ